VALTFDDSWLSQYTNVLPVLESNGIKGTFYITTEPVISYWSDFMTPANVKDLSDKGHEVGGHTVTHAHLTNISSTNLLNELTQSKSYLETLTGKTVYSFAYPYGEWNNTVKNQVVNSGYRTARGTEEDFLNSSTTDRFALKSSCILKNTSISSIVSEIYKAKNNKQLYIICIHEVKEGGDEYTITPFQFAEIINQIKISGIKTMTVKEATDKLFGLEN
jgi:peptidoglycan/xylan/chitin deacetylase (PgdA/CDA1 family)